MMAKKKFDTNPLDSEFPDKVLETKTTALPKNSFATAEFPTSNPTEEQTRRFDNANFNTYQSPYDGKNVPASYKKTNLYADMNQSSNRKVAGIGLPENILTAVPYIPWFIGLIAGVIILFLAPRSETKVRFHAAQGLAAHLAILIISAILGGLTNIFSFGNWGNGIFQIVTTIMLIIFAVKAWQGKPVHIEAVDDLTEWLEDKIKPSK
jgi:uncharacterized membrane protein